MKKRKLNLQLFAEDVNGASSGNVAGEAGSQLATGTAGVSEGNNQVAPGQTTAQEMSFDDLIKSNPAYKKEFDNRMQSAIKARVKDTKQLQGRMDKVLPVMEMFGQKYGIDASNLTDDVLDQITNKIMGDNSFYEEQAMQAGMDVETYKAMQNMRRENAQLQRFKQQTEQNAESQRRFMAINRDAEQVKQLYPGFNLDTEMENPDFQRLVWNAGVPLKTAYEVIHQNEIMAAAMQMTAQRTAEKVSNNVQSGMYRPQESGISGQSASLTEDKSPKNWSKEEREAIIQRVKNGERIVF